MLALNQRGKQVKIESLDLLSQLNLREAPDETRSLKDALLG